MIEVLNATQIRESKLLLEDELKKYASILYLSPDLLINQIVRGELAVFNVNNEVLALCKRFSSGNESVFFVAFAFSTISNGFFGFRQVLKKHFQEISDYVKKDLGCDRLEFMCVGNAHTQMYKTVLSKFSDKIKHEHYFKITL